MREFSGGNTRKMLLNSLRTTLHHVFKFVKLRQFFAPEEEFEYFWALFYKGSQVPKMHVNYA